MEHVIIEQYKYEYLINILSNKFKTTTFSISKHNVSLTHRELLGEILS